MTGDLDVQVSKRIAEKGDYLFTIKIDGANYQSGDRVEITFPSGMLTGTETCEYKDVTLNPCTIDVASNKVSVTGSFSITSAIAYDITVKQVNNPGIVQVYNCKVQYFTATDGSLKSTTDLSFVPLPAQLLNPTFVMDSGLVGKTGVKYTFGFTLKTQVGANGLIQIDLPKREPLFYDFTASSIPFTSFMTPTEASQCTGTGFSGTISCALTIGNMNTADKIVITGGFTSQVAANTAITVVFPSVTNPVSTRPIDFTLTTLSQSNQMIDSNTYSVACDTAADFNGGGGVILDSVKEIGQPGVYYFEFIPSQHIPAGASILIDLPPEVTFDTSNPAISTTGRIKNVNPNATLTKQFNGPASQVLIQNAFIELEKKELPFYVTITPFKNPGSAADTSSFSVTILDGTYEINKKTTDLVVKPDPRQLQEVSVAFAPEEVLETAEYTIKFKPVSDFGPTSKLEVTFPEDFTISDGVCQVDFVNVIGSALGTCTVIGNKVTIPDAFQNNGGYQNPGSLCELKIKGIRNPKSIKPTQPFSIMVVDANSNAIDGNLDQTVTAKVNTLIALSFIPQNSQVYAAPVEYTFSMTTKFEIPQHSKLLIKFPLGHYTFTTTAACVTPNGFNGSSCAVNPVNHEFRVVNGFDGGDSANPGALTWKIQDIRNARSFRPSDPIEVIVSDKDDFLSYQFKGDGTPTDQSVVTLNTPNPTSIGSFQPDSTLCGMVTNYKVGFKPTIPLKDNDIFRLVFPPECEIQSSISCTPGLNILATPTCVKVTLPDGSIAIDITFTLGRRRFLAAGDIGTLHEVTINGIRNPPAFDPTADSTKFITMDQGEFEMERLETGYKIQNQGAGEIITASVEPLSVGLEEETEYIFKFLPEAYHQDMYIEIVIPPELQLKIPPQIAQINGFNALPTLNYAQDGQVSGQGANVLIIEKSFLQPTRPNGEIEFKIITLKNPNKYLDTTSFRVRTRMDIACDPYGVAPCVTSRKYIDIVAPIRCQDPCFGCTTIRTECTKCDPSKPQKYLMSELQTCVEECPAGYFNNDEFNCVKCVLPCLECAGSNKTCTKCVSSLNLYQNSCVEDCPVGTYLEGNICVSYNEFIIPFPFLITCLIITIGILIAKCRGKNTRFVISSIALIGLVEIVAWGYILYLFWPTYSQSRGMAILGLGFMVICNFMMMVGYNKWIKHDDSFQEYKNKNKCTACMLITFSVFCTHRLWRLTYSYLGETEAMSSNFASYSLTLRIIKVISIISICLASLPLIVSAGFNMFFSSATQQVFYTDIEVIIISSYIIFLIIYELCVFHPKDQQEHYRQINHISDTTNSSITHYGSDSGIKPKGRFNPKNTPNKDQMSNQERMLRAEALKSIINQLKADNHGQGGESKLFQAFKTQERRFSDPGGKIKSKFFKDDPEEENFDNRQIASNPLTPRQQQKQEIPIRDDEFFFRQDLESRDKSYFLDDGEGARLLYNQDTVEDVYFSSAKKEDIKDIQTFRTDHLTKDLVISKDERLHKARTSRKELKQEVVQSKQALTTRGDRHNSIISIHKEQKQSSIQHSEHHYNNETELDTVDYDQQRKEMKRREEQSNNKKKIKEQGHQKGKQEGYNKSQTIKEEQTIEENKERQEHHSHRQIDHNHEHMTMAGNTQKSQVVNKKEEVHKEVKEKKESIIDDKKVQEANEKKIKEESENKKKEEIKKQQEEKKLKEAKDQQTKEEKLREENEKKHKEEQERIEKEQKDKKLKEDQLKAQQEQTIKEQKLKEQKDKELKEKQQKEEQERKDKDLKEKEEKLRKEKEELDRKEKERKDKEEKDRLEREKKQKQNQDIKEQQEKEKKLKEEQDLKDKQERDRKAKEEKERKEKEQKEKQQKAEQDRKQKEERERKEKLLKEQEQKELQNKQLNKDNSKVSVMTEDFYKNEESPLKETTKDTNKPPLHKKPSPRSKEAEDALNQKQKKVKEDAEKLQEEKAKLEKDKETLDKEREELEDERGKLAAEKMKMKQGGGGNINSTLRDQNPMNETMQRTNYGEAQKAWDTGENNQPHKILEQDGEDDDTTGRNLFIPQKQHAQSVAQPSESVQNDKSVEPNVKEKMKEERPDGGYQTHRQGRPTFHPREERKRDLPPGVSRTDDPLGEKRGQEISPNQSQIAPDEEASAVKKSRGKSRGKRKGVKESNEEDVLFSDKSESSIASMMEDTPSNYNAINGRLDGESKGLKTFQGLNLTAGGKPFMNHQKKNTPYFASGGSGPLEMIQEKAPNHLKGVKTRRDSKHEQDFINEVISGPQSARGMPTSQTPNYPSSKHLKAESHDLESLPSARQQSKSPNKLNHGGGSGSLQGRKPTNHVDTYGVIEPQPGTGSKPPLYYYKKPTETNQGTAESDQEGNRGGLPPVIEARKKKKKEKARAKSKPRNLYKIDPNLNTNKLTDLERQYLPKLGSKGHQSKYANFGSGKKGQVDILSDDSDDVQVKNNNFL